MTQKQGCCYHRGTFSLDFSNAKHEISTSQIKKKTEQTKKSANFRRSRQKLNDILYRLKDLRWRPWILVNFSLNLNVSNNHFVLTDIQLWTNIVLQINLRLNIDYWYYLVIGYFNDVLKDELNHECDINYIPKGIYYIP